MVTLASLSLIGYILFARKELKFPISTLPFLIISFCICLFYLFSYAQQLRLVAFIFLILGILSLLSAPFYLRREKPELFDQYLTPSFCLFIFYFLIFGLMGTQLVIAGNDEIARWLPHIRDLAYQQGFWGNADAISDKDYPPGGALFSYLFLQFENFSDSKVLIAQLLLCLSPILVLVHHFNWKNWFQAFLWFSLVLLVLTVFMKVRIGATASIMMDKTCGLFFGASLAIIYLFSEKKNLGLYLAISLAALILLRPMMSLFVITVGFFLMIDLYFFATKADKNYRWFVIGVALLVPLVFLASWQHYLSKIGTNSIWNLSLLLHAIKTASLNRFSPTEWNLFLQHYLITSARTAVFLLVITTLIFFIFIRTQEPFTKKRLLVWQLCLSMGFISYYLLLTLLYLFQMPTTFVIELNSFERFLGIYCIGWFMVTMAQGLEIFKSYLEKVNLSRLWQYLIVTSTACSLLGITIIQNHDRQKHFAAKTSPEYWRSIIHQTAALVSLRTKKNDRITMIWMDDVDHSYFYEALMSYELFPRTTIERITDPSIYDANIFKKQLGQADYLILASADPKFWQHLAPYSPKNKSKPLTILSYYPTDTRSHTLKTLPIFLYKIIKHTDHIYLINVSMNDSVATKNFA